MIEHIKTGTLWFLILLSIYLTFQIWTFQPDYGILKSTEYIDNRTIGEEKKLRQVIQPTKIIFHDSKATFAPMDHKEKMERLLEEYSGITLGNFSLLRNLDSDEIQFGIDLYFPSPIPLEVIKEVFQLTSNPSPLQEVDQISFFIAEEQQRVMLRLLSLHEKAYIEAETNISISKFIEDITVEKETEFYEVFIHELINYGNGFKKAVYLPVESLEVKNVTYLARSIPTEYFKQSLFSDPNFVKHYLQSNGEESFTDGNRMVNIFNGGNVLRYINPSFGDLVDRQSKHVLYTALDFLNGHGGLTNNYYYDGLKAFGNNEEVVFRLMIDGIPVYSSNSVNHLFEITLTRSSGVQIEQYVRPLFYLEEDPINIINSINLPSGLAVVEALKQLEDFEPYLLDNIKIGYRMVKRQSFIIFEPEWFIHYNGSWQSITIKELENVPNSEAITGGLE